MSVLYVFNTNKVLVGRLISFGATVSFKYARSFMESPLELNPFQLPKKPTKFSENGFTGKLSVFRDSLPGFWGQEVINNIKGYKLNDFELLLEDQSSRIGNLIYNTEEVFPQLSSAVESFDWNEVLSAKKAIEQNISLTDKQKILLAKGSAQGGARPKLNIIKNGKSYLVKLSLVRDYSDNQSIEHGSMRLAAACGINVAKTEIFSIGQNNVLLVERFDRSPIKSYLSLAAVCGDQHSCDASYLDFAEELKRFGRKEDLLELFKRMAFNVFISNKDDHWLNHGIIYKDSWELSPAFDIVIGEGTSKFHSLYIGEDGKERTKKNVISSADYFDLTKEQAESIIEDMLAVLKNWKSIFKKEGISDKIIEDISWAVCRKDIFKDNRLK